MTGFATSVIGCKVEASIEAVLSPEERLEQVALTYLEEVVGARLEPAR